MKFSSYYTVFSILFYSITFSQTVEPSSVVANGLLQLEMGVDYANRKEGIEEQLTWSLPSVLCRYGFFNALELHFLVPLVKEQLYAENYRVNNTSNFQNIQVGAAVKLWKQNNILPEAALMARMCLPFKNEENFNNVSKNIALNFSNTFLEKYSLNCNLGYTHSGEGSNAGYYVLNLSYNLDDSVHFFIENFSEFCYSSPCTQTLNIGGGFTLCKNMVVDLSVAKGVNYDLFYTSALLTWVINTNH